MVLIGEDVGLSFMPAQLNNNFGFNWLLKKVYVGSRRVFPNTDGFTVSPDPLLGSMCNVYWNASFTDWQQLPVLTYNGSTNTSYFERVRNNPPPGSQYLYYTDRYECATAVGSYTTYESYSKRMTLRNVENTSYQPEDAHITRSIRIPQYVNCLWLHHDDGVTSLQVHGAVAYAIVIVKGNYASFKNDFDAANGFVFLNGSSYGGSAALGVWDPVASDPDSRVDELIHSGFRTTNKLLGVFTSGGDIYSIVAMKGKLSSQPALPSYIVTGMVSQPFLISNSSNNVPMPTRCLLLGAEYYGYQRTPS